MCSAQLVARRDSCDLNGVDRHRTDSAFCNLADRGVDIENVIEFARSAARG